MLKKLIQTTLAVVALSSALPANAAIILASDFTGTSGDPTNVSWTESGVSVTNTLTPQTTSLTSIQLFDNFDNVFAVDYNIHNEGTWFVDILLSTSSFVDNIKLDSFSLDASIYNNRGQLQNVQRDFSLSLDIFEGASSFFSSAVDVFNGDNNKSGFTPVKAIEFDMSNLVLHGGTDYVFRLTAFGNGGGNNAGFDNLVLTGTATNSSLLSVPAPGSLAILMTSLAILIFRKRK
ncbi:PEP-CTERM sorting domain-containing protein [Alteromonas genovensis]|uniref:PEP-CTERM sorting domain-containing protein n=1 Tax=Alteromonas genovensis TaxID=471225 RepID=A0A6N9TJF4_9ALTE|nr:PEP-CTERM sorting domain-containing protein [Alteromonas genovensis]NDW17270.1 PEP-CTERM sorting domain-containing protein [Alteromonas genovensis]